MLIYVLFKSHFLVYYYYYYYCPIFVWFLLTGWLIIGFRVSSVFIKILDLPKYKFRNRSTGTIRCLIVSLSLCVCMFCMLCSMNKMDNGAQGIFQVRRRQTVFLSSASNAIKWWIITVKKKIEKKQISFICQLYYGIYLYEIYEIYWIDISKQNKEMILVTVSVCVCV